MVQRWFGARGRWQRLGLSALAGALMTTGHAPVNLPWMLFIAVPVLGMLMISAPTGRAAASVGWGAGFGYFVTGLHWVGHAFLVDPDRFALLLPLGVAALPAGLAFFWALAFWAAWRLGRTPLAGGLALATTWSVVEVARTHVLTGFPWALPGYVWVETPVMQMAAHIGPHGMTLFTLLVTGLPGLVLLAGERRRVLVGVCSAALLAGAWTAGMVRMPAEAAPDPAQPLLRIVQPNAAQHLKWAPGHRETFYERAIEATAAPSPEGPPDAVIWPETAMYFLPSNNPAELERLAARLGGVPLITGALHVEGPREAETWYNSLFVIAPDGAIAARYDKHHLVPFGEYLPLPWLLGLLGLEKFGLGGGFGRGPGPQTLKLPGLPAFSPLICYEAIFPHQVVGGARPDWLLQITNDAWFGNFAGPQQHLAQARIRAIEQGLPLVRAANTGISAVIGPYGRIRHALGLGQSGYIDARLPGKLPPTVYGRTGDWPVYVLIILLLGGLAWRRRA